MNAIQRAALLLLWTCLAGMARAELPMGVSSATGSTTFRVWAPNAFAVAVVGDFNNWKAMQGDKLVLDEATGIWSGTFKRSLPKGGYQFLINGTLAKRDPYGRTVTPDGNVSVFYDPSAFNWGNDASPGIALEDTIIYEMHVGCFFDPKPEDGMPATFADAAKKLDYLVELGVNTLCILPIHEFNGFHSWGYNPCDLFAVEQAYGGPDGLKQFVKACHARGLAVHLDIVHNHYGPQNLDLLQFDGSGNPANGGIYFYEGEEIGMTPWGPRVRFESPMVHRFILDNVMMWLNEYRIDGFRWDSTVNIRAYNMGANPLPAGAKMLESINQEIKKQHPGKWSIAEDSLNIGNFHGSWQYDFHHEVMPVLSAASDNQRSMRSIAGALRYDGKMTRVVYVDNHDEAGKINGQFRIATDIDPADPGGDRARKLSGLGAVLTLTAPGIPLLFMGNEFQEYGTFHDNIPLDWNKTTKHAGMLALHRALIRLRLNKDGYSVGLKGNLLQIPVLNEEQKHIVYWRGHENNSKDQVVVAINFSGQASEVIIPFPANGSWMTRLDTDHVMFGGASQYDMEKPFPLVGGSPKITTTMPPYSARIFSLAVRSPMANAPVKAPVETSTTTESDAAEKEKRPLSMYTAIRINGNFTSKNPTAWTFKLVTNYTWEGKFTFSNIEKPSFRLSANMEDVVFWGGADAGSEAPQNGGVTVKRLGKNLTGNGIWSGLYRFRFNEDTQHLDIEKIGEAPGSAPQPPTDTSGYRAWKDVRGAVLEAKLVDANDTMISLVRKDGQRMQIPISKFSESDQEYVNQWREENE